MEDKKKYPFSWLKHNRDEEGDYGARFMIHLPLGFFISLFFPFSYPVLKLFIRYEENEDVHKKDQAWKDYAGAIGGAIAGVTTLVAGITALILWCLGVI